MSWFTDLFKRNLAQEAKQCFNAYQDYFTGLDSCDETLDVTVKVRIRAFGSEKVKQAAWDKDWRSETQQRQRIVRGEKQWGPVAAGVSVSSKIPEIWCDCRITKSGIVINPAILGHEMLHTLRQKDKRVCYPDLLINESIY